MNSDWNLSLVLAIGELLADPQQPKALLEACMLSSRSKA